MNPATPPPMRVISLGDLVVDIVLSIPRLPVEASQHQPTRQIQLEPGGAGNFLIAGARLGIEMIALGTVGADDLGGLMLNILHSEAVDLTGIIRQPGTTSTTVIVLVDQAGQNVFLGGYGSGPEIELPPGWMERLSTVQAVFACGYTLAEKRDALAALQMMSLARRDNLPVFFDPGPEMRLATPAQVKTVLAESRILLLTEEEIPALTGGMEGIAAAQALLKHGPSLVCIKRGPQGCLLLTRQGSYAHPGFPVRAIDPTGAGDSFAAAFIFAYLMKWPLEQVAAFANAMGAAKVQKLGSGRQVPTAAEVRSVLAQYAPDHPYLRGEISN